ncbi:MAG: DNA-processing protein DprA [Christensenellales bacterium]|jgi:DNA processing protein
MAYTEREKAWIWLSGFEGMDAHRFDCVLSVFPDPRDVMESGTRENLSFLQNPKLIEKILSRRSRDYLDDYLDMLDEKGIRCLIRESGGFPPMLRGIPMEPAVLYVKGRDDVPLEKCIAMVGSRRCSRYGLEMTGRIAKGLAAQGVVTVSGLARGIDSAAHRASLEAGGMTIGVLGCGVDVVYPAENERLFRDVMERGMIISEYPPGTTPHKMNFPPRNRIISGLSSGVVLIEAQEKSGTMITVRHATEQGREVFAVPANITSPQSYWPNRLIREGAALVLDAQDILSELRWDTVDKKASEKGRETLEDLILGDEEALIVAALMKGEMIVDELCMVTGLSAQNLNVHLTTLEMQEIIEQFPGMRVALHNKYGV